MKTITLQIGNSDDKLTQKEWAQFVATIDREVTFAAKQVHFSGPCPGNSPWQNACWVFETEPSKEDTLKHWVKGHRERFKQDSVAWTEGITQFV